MDPASLAGLSPEELAMTPGGMPPHGVIPDLLHPTSYAYIFYGPVSTLLAFMLFFLSLRFYAKTRIQRKVTADDWFALLAAIGTIGYFIICVLAITQVGFGIHNWDLSITHVTSPGVSKYSFLFNFPSLIVWALAKTAFLLMYLQIFNPFRWVRWACYFGLAVNTGFYLSALIATLYFTIPGSSGWQAHISTGRGNRIIGLSVPIAAMSLSLDLYILAIPIAAISRLQLRLSRKIGAGMVFATGIGACIASSLSVYYKVRLNEKEADFMYETLYVMTMSMTEMCVGVACSSMPACAKVFRTPEGGWRSVLSRTLKSRTSDTSTTFRQSLRNKSPRTWPRSQGTRQHETTSQVELWGLKKDSMQTVIGSQPQRDVDLEQGQIQIERTIDQESSKGSPL